MKSLLRKELREHFKVAVLGLIVLAIMLFLGFKSCGLQTQQAALGHGNDAKQLQPLLSSTVLMQVAFFCAIFGTLLGWLQVRAESHPDLWAFLVHRPVTRTTIFRSKVISGLLLYVAATGLPLFGLIVAASLPGLVAAPFAWAMALPLTALFFSGMVFYFAGLLTGLRKARWFASRGFGLGPAVLTSIGVINLPEFWQAMLIVVAAGVILALAVWGSFQTDGHYRAQPFLGKAALTVASVVSVALVIAVALGFTMSLIFRSSRDYTYSYYQVLKDGRIAKITQHAMGGALEDAEIVDLNGQSVLDEKTGQPIKLKELQQRLPLSLGATVNFENALRKRYRNREGYADAARFFTPWRVLHKTIWYLTADGRLVAYNGITRRVVAHLEPPGNTADGSADDTRFLHPNDYAWSYLREYTRPEVLASARSAYVVDLEKRELKPFFTVTNGDAIGGCAENQSAYDPTNPEAVPVLALTHFALILTHTSIQVMDIEGRPFLRVPYEPVPPAYPSVTAHWLRSSNMFAVRFEPDYFLNEKSGGKLLTHVKWTNPDGSIRNESDLPKLPVMQQNNSSELLTIPLIPPGVPFYSWEQKYRIAQVLRLGPAILCALIGWWLGRRNNFSLKARVGWGVFNFLLGIPGLLAFLAVQEWSPKERCPRCKKLRVVRREKCEHCGSEFAPAPKTGTEIFEPLTTD